MADQDDTVQGQNADQQAAADAAARQTAEQAEKVAQKADRDRLVGIETRLAALADTVKAAVTPRHAQAAQGDGTTTPGQIPPHFRNLLRQQGLTDADIDANAPIVVPFLSAMLATDGTVMLSSIQSVKDEVEMVKAAKQTKKFPYWSDLEDKVVELREEAQKQGLYLSPSDAYKTAVANDIASPDSQIAKARQRQAAEEADRASSAGDVTAQNLHGTHHGARPGHATVRRTALTAEEIEALPRAERKKLFEEGGLGDLPIR